MANKILPISDQFIKHMRRLYNERKKETSHIDYIKKWLCFMYYMVCISIWATDNVRKRKNKYEYTGESTLFSIHRKTNNTQTVDFILWCVCNSSTTFDQSFALHLIHAGNDYFFSVLYNSFASSCFVSVS